MGNLFSSSSPEKKDYHQRGFGSILDYIASNYILTSDFKSLTKLYDEKYCNDLVVLTSDIIQKNFDELELTYLAQRTKHGEVIDLEEKARVVFFNKESLNDMDVSSKTQKTRICQSIAKFYVKIAHIFAAILMTINPVYLYKNERGELIETPLKDKKNIPVNSRDRRVVKRGLCHARLQSLMRGQDNIPNEGTIHIHHNVCKSDKRSRTKTGTSTGTETNTETNLFEKGTLHDEPGIPELYPLYLDKYDYRTRQYTDMLDGTKKQYMKDLKNFYEIFTGKTDFESRNIRRFGDIQLKDYSNSDLCMNKNKRNVRVEGNVKDDLFYKYAENLKKMMQTTEAVNKELLDIINQLFIYELDEKNKKKMVRVNPSLTEDKLQSLVVKTRQIIIQYYLSCENDFSRGVLLYEAIVENQLRETSLSRIQGLETLSGKLITPYSNSNTNSKTNTNKTSTIEPTTESSFTTPTNTTTTSSSSLYSELSTTTTDRP